MKSAKQVNTEKRGPGRPRKIFENPTAVKRGPGRPRKEIPVQEIPVVIPATIPTAVKKQSVTFWGYVEVAVYLGKPGQPLAITTIKKMVKMKGLPSHPISDRNVKFLKSEIDKWIAQQK